MIQMIGLYTRHAGYWDEDTLCTGPVADADDGDDEWDTTNHDKYEDEDYEYVDGIEKHDVTPQLWMPLPNWMELIRRPYRWSHLVATCSL